ncbi:hypothetical protein NQZ68_012596 [Dissostichus eleginoides]|nr:hypothetical protein NQZ68_012596 [Dissostichus eleginoides]
MHLTSTPDHHQHPVLQRADTGGASGGAVGAGLPGPGTVGTQWGPVAEAAGSAPEIFAGGPCCLAPLSALTFVVILDEPEVVATASRVSSPNDSVKNVPGVKQFYDTVETLYNFFGHSIKRWALLNATRRIVSRSDKIRRKKKKGYVAPPTRSGELLPKGGVA